VQLHLLKAGTKHDIDIASATLVERRVGALLVATDGFLLVQCNRLVALARHHAVPAMYSYRECALAGDLMSYDASLTDASHQAGLYVGRILKGAKPADLPVQQSVKVELVVNLKAARALGLTVPLSLLGRADEVIERTGATETASHALAPEIRPTTGLEYRASGRPIGSPNVTPNATRLGRTVTESPAKCGVLCRLTVWDQDI
jgi:ABC transporter substrate binding protein